MTEHEDDDVVARGPALTGDSATGSPRSPQPNGSQHSPGPWKWFDYPDGRKLLSGTTRAVIHCPDAPMTCDPADARLIESAPDLLRLVRGCWHLCESLLAVREGATDESIRRMSEALATAIAKAEGRA